MGAMEKMLASMIGMKPEEMQALVKGVAQAASEGVEMLTSLKADLANISERLERIENGPGK